MPIPFLVVGALVAGAYGAKKHSDAKQKNIKAMEVQEEAQAVFNRAMYELNQAQENTKKALTRLGRNKQRAMETTFVQFSNAFNKIKNIEITNSVGSNELQNLMIDTGDILDIKQMADIYNQSISSAAAGSATGALIAIAAGGYVPVMTGMMSAAGSAVAIGEVGLASGIAGSALSIGAAVTPLAAIAGPALLFSGLTANSKAQGNLNRAQTTLSEANREAEKMKTMSQKCYAISQSGDMFNKLLKQLHALFMETNSLMCDMITKKTNSILGSDMVDVRKLTDDEKKLIAVTRSLAGAVKAIIDMPMISQDGELILKSKQQCEHMKSLIPVFTEKVEAVKKIAYKTVPVTVALGEDMRKNTKNSSIKGKTVIFAKIIGVIIIAAVIGGIIVAILAPSSSVKKQEKAANVENTYTEEPAIALTKEPEEGEKPTSVSSQINYNKFKDNVFGFSFEYPESQPTLQQADTHNGTAASRYIAYKSKMTTIFIGTEFANASATLDSEMKNAMREYKSTDVIKIADNAYEIRYQPDSQTMGRKNVRRVYLVNIGDHINRNYIEYRSFLQTGNPDAQEMEIISHIMESFQPQ